MVKSINDSQEIIHKLHLVQEFMINMYNGEKQYKSRISFILRTLDDVIAELEGNKPIVVASEIGRGTLSPPGSKGRLML